MANVFGNKQVMANLTNLFWYDSSLGTISGNLLNSPPPYALLPALPGVSDCLYCGCDTLLLNSGHFTSIAFTLGPWANTFYTIAWEVYTAAGWIAYAGTDSTINLAVTGVVNWSPIIGANQMTIVNLNALLGAPFPSVTGYWIRGRLTAAAGNSVVEVNRHPYHASFAAINTVNTAVLGDVVNPVHFANRIEYATSYRVCTGLRSISRGTDFQAYLNASDTQNPTWMPISLSGACSYQASLAAPTGRCIRYVRAAALPLESAFYWLIVSPYANQYDGIYRGFLRCYLSSGSINVLVQVLMGSGYNTVCTSQLVPISTASTNYMIDLGTLFIPPKGRTFGQSDNLWILVRIEVVSVGATAYFYDIALIPYDEGYHESVFQPTAFANQGTFQDIDYITYPKDNYRSVNYSGSNTAIVSGKDAADGKYMLRPNISQRAWFLAGADTIEKSYPYQAFTNKVFQHQSTYFSMRGTR